MDPKARELRHFVGSHRHEERLRDAAGLNDVSGDPSMEAAKVLREITAVEDKEDRFDPMQGCKARLEWRAEMDRGIRRLMQDSDLMLDDRLQESTKHALRCNHLDKTYTWFERNGKKEASKERPAPPYLRFEANAPVMPGSLRKDPALRGWAPKPVLQMTPDASQSRISRPLSQASPSLMAAAAQAVGSGTATLPAMSGLQASPMARSSPRPLTGNAASWVPPY